VQRGGPIEGLVEDEALRRIFSSGMFGRDLEPISTLLRNRFTVEGAQTDRHR
jgi:hypothetical protein